MQLAADGWSDAPFGLRAATPLDSSVSPSDVAMRGQQIGSIMSALSIHELSQTLDALHIFEVDSQQAAEVLGPVAATALEQFATLGSERCSWRCQCVHLLRV